MNPAFEGRMYAKKKLSLVGGYLLSLPFPELPYKESWKLSKLSFSLKKFSVIAIHR